MKKFECTVYTKTGKIFDACTFDDKEDAQHFGDLMTTEYDFLDNYVVKEIVVDENDCTIPQRLGKGVLR